MLLHTSVSRLLLVRFLMCVMAGICAGSAAAESIVFDSGLVGVVGGQRARLNVVDVGSAVRGRSCSLQLSFLDSAGQELATAEMAVDPSHAASFEHALERDPLRRVGALMRGRVTQTGEPCADSELVPTLEVLDANGKTMVLQAAAAAKVGIGPVLATSAVFRAGTGLWCFVANVSQTKTVVVDAEAVNEDGTSAILVTQTIAPRVITASRSEPTGKVAAYCRFVLRSGGKEDVRGSYCVEGETGLDCVVTGDAR